MTEHTESYPTINLRFVKRINRGFILQQQWTVMMRRFIDSDEIGICEEISREWRDVPTVEEGS